MPTYRIYFGTPDRENHVRVADYLNTLSADAAAAVGARVTNVWFDMPGHDYDRFTAEDRFDLVREYTTWVTFEAPDDATATVAIHLLQGMARVMEPEASYSRQQKAERLRNMVISAPLTLPHAGPKQVEDLKLKLQWMAHHRGAWAADVMCPGDHIALYASAPSQKVADLMRDAFLSVHRYEELPLREDAIKVLQRGPAPTPVTLLQVKDLPLPPEDAAAALSNQLGLTGDDRIGSGTIRNWLRNGRSPAGELTEDLTLGGVNCLYSSTVARLAFRLYAKNWRPGRRGRPPGPASQ